MLIANEGGYFCRLPHRGQGAVLSIEDAATLGVLFDDNAEPSIATHSVEEKLQYFEDIRQKHVSAIQIISELPLYEDTLTVKRTELLQFIPQSEVPGVFFFFLFVFFILLFFPLLPFPFVFRTAHRLPLAVRLMFGPVVNSKQSRPSRMAIQA